ncbi:MAG: hypothetical protein IPK44_24755 [Candidatus Accumulibacter sp.]|uniref:hypothetical protein n=1 Tax=Accumulibacter sp. TaxID=2053492 RepID=UPI00258B9034|nr:hypothetical protein [Accumulibacter sp.]MBK8117500.1 hypothetical protein [Accumulibacter sp.]
MTCTNTQDIALTAGTSFSLVHRWWSAPIVRKPITGISFATGAPRITEMAHGLTDGWLVACYGIEGLTELNADDPERLRESDYHASTVIDADTIEINEVNAANFRPWAAAKEATALNIDPMFVGNGDYRLSASSALISVGSAVSAYDFLGNPTGGQIGPMGIA